MALVLLVLGVAMSLVGLLAMVTGYPMIEIERGWATVITGAVLLSGGLVVVSLGMVVRHLIGLRGALAAVGAFPQAAEAFVSHHAAVPTAQMPPLSAMPPAPRPDVPMAPASSTAPASSMAPVATAVPVAAAALAGAMHEHEDLDGGRLGHEAFDARRESDGDLRAFIDNAEDEGGRLEGRHANAAVPHDDADALEPREETIASDASWQTHPAAEDDLSAGQRDQTRFDDEIADHALPAGGHSTDMQAYVPQPAEETAPLHEAPVGENASHEHPAHEPSPYEILAHDPANDETEPQHGEAQSGEVEAVEPTHETHPEPDPGEAPSTAPAEPAADLAVIGRYDSEGTSYVMYSDGSIEAQSEAGVYRFGSMAELKAFIEG